MANKKALLALERMLKFRFGNDDQPCRGVVV
jgi:hypothetical protein